MGGAIEVVEAGSFTTVQDHPGRLGLWMVGVPPSGPMDDRSFRLVNRAVGNPAAAAGLECTATGPALRFEEPTWVCLGGALMTSDLDGRPVPWWQPFEVGGGQTLRIGRLEGPGLRSYVAVRGGIDVPVVLGSRSTFTLGGFGGHQGRQLRAGDVLAVGAEHSALAPSPIPPGCWSPIERSWTIGVLDGPHGAADYFTRDDIDTLYETDWTVQSHAARTGVRLEGPKPTWARPDGGEAGLHPSNIHDTGYAFGTLDFTGDTPVALGPDGPSLGGFTCPVTVVAAERWKLGQLTPGDEVRFVALEPDHATALAAETDDLIRRLRAPRQATGRSARRDPDGGVVLTEAADEHRPAMTVRRAGDEFLLVEFGEMRLDLALRARVHVLERWLDEHAPGAFVDLTGGVRSLLVHLDPTQISTADAVDLVGKANDDLPSASELEVPARIVHLPLSWEDPATIEAIERYMQVVRDDAPWCPSNLEFIRRVNGLDTLDDVRRIVFDASYLVLGLGDVYLGAPLATPLDPRHRLVTTKYNPARTWTPQNAVGIGGAYLCVYGMEGPGGYQFVGRTVPVWYLDVPTPGEDPDTPWLLRTFDQIRFHPVPADELIEQRAAAAAGALELHMEPVTFTLADHLAFLDQHADSITTFRATQAAAFAAERDRWRASGEL